MDMSEVGRSTYRRLQPRPVALCRGPYPVIELKRMVHKTRQMAKLYDRLRRVRSAGWFLENRDARAHAVFLGGRSSWCAGRHRPAEGELGGFCFNDGQEMTATFAMFDKARKARMMMNDD